MWRNQVCGAFPSFRPLFIAGLLLLSGCSVSSSPWTPSNSATPVPAAPATASQPQAAVSPLPATPSKVALLLPLTGKGAETGQAMLNAAQLAMFDLGGNSFELLPKDTSQGAETAANEALAEGAGLILGPVFGPDAKTIAPLARARGINILPFSTDTSAAGGNSFLMGFVPQTQVEQIIDFTLGQGMKRIALIAAQDAYGDAVTATYQSSLARHGVPSVGVLRFAAGMTPSDSQILDLSKRPASLPSGMSYNAMSSVPFDAVLIATSGPQAEKISNQLTAIGLPPSSVRRLGTGLWDQAETARSPSLQGAWYAASSPRLRQKFEKRYLETYGQPAPRLASLAYDATALAVVLAKAGRGYGSESLTSPNGFSGIDGIFRFRTDGLAQRGLAILEIRNNMAVVVRDAPSSFLSGGQ
ncbi:MAG: penicillin-binding protein activator [Alphaproteobacteria bacterium]|nr:penicillin-binding protein activator [Alphaproteobacteria bacterium]